jgi:hypothetical protein
MLPSNQLSSRKKSRCRQSTSPADLLGRYPEMTKQRAAMADYLPNSTVHELTGAILSSGLNVPDARNELLTGINRGFVAGLPLRSTTLDQIRSDMVEMNGVPYLIGGEVPLKIWLENAVERLRRGSRPEVGLFQTVLSEVTAKSQSQIAQAAGKPSPPSSGDKLERIIHQDDLLSYGWLKGALGVGTSVARLIVTRHDNGQITPYPGSDKPMRYMGTGWLIGNQHIITCHHVLNARSESEPNAREADLKLQAEKTCIQFDYDSEGLEGVLAPVERLEAWSEWNKKPVLDFAILTLKEPSSRTPLTLVPSQVSSLGKSVLPVNIVQHPKGNPKSLGIRNNLLSSLDEHEVRYYTDTMSGSSGSPVCNDKWQVVGLHRSWNYVHTNLDFQGKPTAWVNIGVRIDRIVDHLKLNHKDLWEQMAAKVL